MLRINENAKQVKLELITQLQKVEVPTIGHINDDLVSSKSLKVNYVNTRFAGTAVTVSIDKEDAAVLHYALDKLRPHDVLIVNINPKIMRSCWGLIMHIAATNKRVNGVVINGCITDMYAIRNNGVQIAFKDHLAKIFRSSSGQSGGVNIPIVIDGLKINPGDAVCVDECGIAAISAKKVDKVIKESLIIQAKEPEIIYSLVNNEIGILSGSTKKIIANLAKRK